VRAHNKESNFSRYLFDYAAVSMDIYGTRTKIARVDYKKFNQVIRFKFEDLSDRGKLLAVA
jgi:hypothetical protein